MDIEERYQDRDEERHPQAAFSLRDQGGPDHAPGSYPQLRDEAT
jgi:hypothetical protein